MPKVFNTVIQGESSTSYCPFHQETIVLVWTCVSGCHLRKPVMIRKGIHDKRQKCIYKDVSIEWCIHFAFRYAYHAPSSVADATQRIYFIQMLGLIENQY